MVNVSCDASNFCGLLGFKGSKGEAGTIRQTEREKHILVMTQFPSY